MCNCFVKNGVLQFSKKKKVAKNFPFGKIRLRITRHLSKKKISIRKTDLWKNLLSESLIFKRTFLRIIDICKLRF